MTTELLAAARALLAEGPFHDSPPSLGALERLETAVRDADPLRPPEHVLEEIDKAVRAAIRELWIDEPARDTLIDLRERIKAWRGADSVAAPEETKHE